MTGRLAVGGVVRVVVGGDIGSHMIFFGHCQSDIMFGMPPYVFAAL
jgi:hypothetical protein